MSRYSLLVSLHVASVIVWLGSGTTIALVALYARRAKGVVLEQFGALVAWMAPRVFAPASLAAVGFGVAAAHEGHWPEMFWFHVGEGAFVFSFLLTVTVRLPLLRRARRGALDAARLAQYLLAVAIAELTVLYLAVADMVSKPSGFGTSSVRYGGVIVAVGFVAAAATAYRARSAPSADSGPTPLERGSRDRAEEPIEERPAA
jgi:hypothetical protein